MNDNKAECLNELIRHRRSIYPRSYNSEPVNKEIVEQMLENANWAPTHKFTEPWRFQVFSGGSLAEFAQFQAERYKLNNSDSFREDKYQKLLTNPLKASFIISIGMKRHEGRVPEIEEVMAVACAVQNMQLTATAYGIGCYWSTGGVTFDNEAKEFYGLEAADKLLGFLYIGNYDEIRSSGMRKPIKEKVIWR